ncbi:cell envelope integrity protein TolA [Polaromonas sp. P1(28)-8]|nr:cell envelope integrity protein TolA [Polaromonas sp. P1(28)-8]
MVQRAAGGGAQAGRNATTPSTTTGAQSAGSQGDSTHAECGHCPGAGEKTQVAAAAKGSRDAEGAEAAGKTESRAAGQKGKEQKAKEELAKRKAAEEAQKTEAKKQDAKDLEKKKQAEALAQKQRQDALNRMMGLAGATGDANAKGSGQKSSGPSAGYAGKIRARVLPNVVFTEDIAGNPTAEVEVRSTPDGVILGQRLVKSSGNKAWDEAVIKAIIRTGTLPRDDDGRVPTPMILEFKPKG